MNKRDARAKALQGELCVSDLRKLIRMAKRKTDRSSVNSQISIDHAAKIYEAALEGRDDSETPMVWRPATHRDGQEPTKDVLLITNILRDCA